MSKDQRLHHAIVSGDYESLNRSLDEILVSNQHELRKKEQLLESTEALYLAVEKGHRKTIMMFARKVLLSVHLGNHSRYELLEIKAENKTLLLAMMFHGQLDLAIEFIELVGQSSLDKAFLFSLLMPTIEGKLLPVFLSQYENINRFWENFFIVLGELKCINDQQKIELLVPNNASEDSWLFTAMKNGRFHEVEVFYSTLLQNKTLGASVKYAVAASRGGPNKKISGLFEAMHQGHHLIVAHCLESILNADLDEDLKVHLMQAMYEEAAPGLYAAMQGGEDVVVQVVLKKVLETKKLHPLNKLKILQALNAQGVPGFYIAIEKAAEKSVHNTEGNRYVKTITTFLNGIAKSNLDEESKEILIEASYKGASALCRILSLAKHELATLVIGKIASLSMISETTRYRLLSSKFNGKHGISYALENDSIDQEVRMTMARDYIHVVAFADGLSPSKRASLLDIRNEKGVPLLITALEEGRFSFVCDYIQSLSHVSENTSVAGMLPVVQSIVEEDKTALSDLGLLFSSKKPKHKDIEIDRSAVLLAWVDKQLPKFSAPVRMPYIGLSLWTKTDPNYSFLLEIQVMLNNEEPDENLFQQALAKLILQSVDTEQYRIHFSEDSLLRLFIKHFRLFVHEVSESSDDCVVMV